MSFKAFAQLLLAGLATLTLAASLIVFHGMLPLILTWMLRLLLSALALYALYLLYHAWHRLSMLALERQARQAEIEHAHQIRRIESERWQTERERLLLKYHHEAARAAQYLSLSQTRSSEHLGQRLLPERGESHQGELPQNVRYEDIQHLIPRGHILVGVGLQGVETKPQAVGACVWIVGLSGTGKTSTTVLRVDERKQDGHWFLGADPHWFKDDSLFHAIYETLDGQPGPYAKRFLAPMATSPAETLAVLQAFLREFQARKSGMRPKPWRKITLLVDEVGSLMDKATATTPPEKEIIELLPSIARICGQEARNFGMGGMFISQQATGIAWLRKVALMVIVHQLHQESEKKLATNNDTKVMEEMKCWPIGRTYILGVGFGAEGPRTVQQPYFTPVIVDSTAEVTENDLDGLIEPLVPKSVYRMAGTPVTSVIEANPASVRNVAHDPFSGDSEAASSAPANVRTFPDSDRTQPGEQANGSSEARPKTYRFTEEEIPQFLAAYRACGNKDKAIQALGKSASRYRQHAGEILAAHQVGQA
jgi:hypothetical protein